MLVGVTTGEAVALLAAGGFLALCLVMLGACAYCVVRLRRESEILRTARVEFEAAAATLRHAAAAAQTAAAHLDDRARVKSAGTRLAYEAVSGPVVKGLALASGVGQAARSLGGMGGLKQRGPARSSARPPGVARDAKGDGRPERRPPLARKG